MHWFNDARSSHKPFRAPLALEYFNNNNNNNNYIYSAHIPFGICSYAHDNLIRRI